MQKTILSLALLLCCAYSQSNASQLRSGSVEATACEVYSAPESSNMQQKQKRKSRKQLTQELQQLQDEKKLQEQIELVRQAATSMAGMLMKKITPATGTNPSCSFNKANIYLSAEKVSSTNCYVTLTWDAKTTRFSGNYQQCELSGNIEIIDLGRTTEIVFYPDVANQAVANCEAGSSWRKQDEFSMKVKNNAYNY